jgi:hypothetical protein
MTSLPRDGFSRITLPRVTSGYRYSRFTPCLPSRWAPITRGRVNAALGRRLRAAPICMTVSLADQRTDGLGPGVRQAGASQGRRPGADAGARGAAGAAVIYL